MKKIFLFSFCALLLGSCANQEELGSLHTDECTTPLSVSSASLDVPQTKATLLSSGSIGVYLLATNGYTAQNNVQYSCTSGTWSKVSSDILLSTRAATLRACYPYDASYSNPSAIPLTSQLYSSAKDFCYSSPVTISASSPVASFSSMNRAYARIKFTIIHDTGYHGNSSITSLSIAQAGIKTATTLDITSGVYATGTAGSVTFNPGIASIASGSSAIADVLMIPVTTVMSSNLVLTFIVDGSTMLANLPANIGFTTLVPGTQYQMYLTLKETTLVLTSVKITDWTDAATNAATVYKK